MESSLTKLNRGGKRRPKAEGRIWIVRPSWKPPAPSPCEARAGRGLGRGAPSIELARLSGIPSPLPSPHSSVVGRGSRPAAWVVLRGAQRRRYGPVSVENAKEGVRWSKQITPKLHCSNAAVALPTFRLCKPAQRIKFGACSRHA